MRRLQPLAVFAVCLMSLGTSQADLLDSEDFESYNNVPFEIFDANDWEVALDFEDVVNVVDANLSFSQGAVTVDGGNRALEVGPDMPGATTDNFVDWFFEEVVADDQPDVWFSYLIQTSETASTAIPDLAEDRDFFQMHFSADGNQAQSVSVVIDNASPQSPILTTTMSIERGPARRGMSPTRGNYSARLRTSRNWWLATFRPLMASTKRFHCS